MEAEVLILTRKAEQGIVIDGVITVRILSIDGDRVKVSIDAPRHITILREELTEESEEIKQFIRDTVDDAGGSILSRTLASQIDKILTGVSPRALRTIIEQMISHGELVVEGEFITLKS